MITENLDFGILDGEQRKIYFKDADNIEHFLGLAYIDQTDEQYKVSLVSKDNAGNISVLGVNGSAATMKSISFDLNKVTCLSVTQNAVQISSNNPDFEGITYLGGYSENKTTAQILAIENPEIGKQYFNLDNNCICYFNGSDWKKVISENL
jgi:hypothetical protein